MEKFEPIDVEFLINSEEVKSDSERVKADITGIAQTAEQATAKVNQQVKKLMKESSAEAEKLYNFTNEQIKAMSYGGEAGKAGAGNSELSEKARLLASVKEEYRGLLEEGTAAYNSLDPRTRQLTLQLINNKDALRQVSLAQNDLNKRFEMGAISAKNFERASAALVIKEGQLRAEMQKVNQELGVQNARAGQSKAQWNGLQNSVNQLSRELPAFTYSAQTGFMAISNNIPILADEINRLRTQNQLLTESGQKATPVWRQIVGALFSWQTALSLGITLVTVYGKEIGNFISSLFKGKTAIDSAKESLRLLNEAYVSEDYKKAVAGVTELTSNIDLAKRGIIDADDVVDQYNETLGKVTGSVNTLAEAEQMLIDKAPDYVKMMLYKSAAAAALKKYSDDLAELVQKEVEANEKLAEAQKAQEQTAGKRRVNFSASGAATFVPTEEENDVFYRNRQIEVVKKELAELEDSGLKVYNKLNEAAAKIAQQNNFDFLGGKDKKGKKTADKAISDRQSLLDKLAALDAEYSRKSFTKDEEELQALRDKFGRIRELVERFNKDPKNKLQQIGLEGLDSLQVRAEGDLKYRQETDKLKEEIAAQKKVYADYEDYKTKFGKAKADERFKNEKAEADSYSDYLKDVLAKNQAAKDAVAGGTGTGGQIERVALLENAIQVELNAEQKKFDAMLAKLLSYQEEKNLIEERYAEKTLQLQTRYTGDDYNKRLAALMRAKDAELKVIDDAAFKESELYREMNEKLLGMTKAEILKRLNELNSALTSGMFEAADGTMMRLTQEQIEALKKAKLEIEKTLKQSASQSAAEISGAMSQIGQTFQQLSSSIGSLNPELAATLETMGDLAQVGADAAGSVASFAAGDIVGGITKGIKAIAGVFNIARKSRESAKRAQEELLKLQQQAEEGERRLNMLQRQRNIAKAKELELTLQQVDATRQALKLAEMQNQKEANDLMKQLQQQKFVSGSRTERYGGFLGIGRQSRVVNEYSSLAGKTFEEIEALYEKGQLDDKAKELFEQLRKLQQEGVDISEQLSQLQDQTNQIWTATTRDSIADSIISGLREGKGAVEDFAGDMEKLLQNAILNAIKYQVLEEPLQKLYEEFAKMAESDGELTEDEAAAIRAKYEETVQKAIDQYDAWSSILDQSAIEAGDQQGLAGGIRRELTEATGTELAGLFRGFLDVSRRHVLVTERQLDQERRHLDATLIIMASNAMIEAHTANTVERLDRALIELKAIQKNTKPAQSGRDLGN